MPTQIVKFESGITRRDIAASDQQLDEAELRVLKAFDAWRLSEGTIKERMLGVQWRRVRGPTLDVADGGWYFLLEVLYDFPR